MEEVKKQGMESLFVPYKIALALKELGFDKDCFGHYVDGTLDLITTDINDYPPMYVEVIKAPLCQQTFRWFREKYNLYCGFVEPKRISIREAHNNYYTISSETDEEAEIACLRKLIEIVKENL